MYFKCIDVVYVGCILQLKDGSCSRQSISDEKTSVTLAPD